MSKQVLLSRSLHHANTSAYGTLESLLQHLLGNVDAALNHADASINFAQKFHLPFWGSIATLLKGWALCRRGDTDQGIKLVQSSIARCRETGAEAVMTLFHSALADSYRLAGAYEEALAAAETGISISMHQSEGFHEAELHRLKGVVLTHLRPKSFSEAERSLLQALGVSRSQGSKSMELRIATDLSRFWRMQKRTSEALSLLSPVYNWFTEGFDTQDLKDAKVELALLQ
jgi:predicted ATPase